MGNPKASFRPGAKKAGVKPKAMLLITGPPPMESLSVTCKDADGVKVNIDAFAQMGPKPRVLGGRRGVSRGIVPLPAKFTPPPTKPKMPMPSVHGESSLSLNATPVARLEMTPLSLRATPKRFCGGNTPPTVPAGKSVVRWMFGMVNCVPSRNSLRSSPLRFAGFQYVEPELDGCGC